jgi:oxygen-independent coproporphyrinogen-3 oxidase
VRSRIPTTQYLEAVQAELALTPLDEPLETIYFGGGTPSLLPPVAIATLLDSLASRAGFGETVEITLEANPEDVTEEAADAWRVAGVNRISLGVQSFDDRVLQWMHRVHDAERSRSAVGTLRAAGFDNVSLDLIFALPAELGRDWVRDLDSALALEPAHLSLYGLTVEPRTPLDRWIARGATSAPSDDRYAEEYLVAHDRLAASGLTFYEVSNAAHARRQSRHNSAYWTGHPYAGLGPAAHSYDGRARRWNLSAWEAYRRAMEQRTSAVESEEILSTEQQALERLYLGLRTVTGAPLADLRVSPVALAALVEQGWVVEQAGHVKCTVEGWLRLDSLVTALTEPTAAS